jgi:hypothetical protein
MEQPYVHLPSNHPELADKDWADKLKRQSSEVTKPPANRSRSVASHFELVGAFFAGFMGLNKGPK